MENEKNYSIQTAARRSGLTPHVIRAWEKRYGAISPGRTETRRRRFTEQDIRRLDLLHRVTKAGHRIHEVARLSDEELIRRLPAPAAGLGGVVGGTAADFREEFLRAITGMDPYRLDSILRRASVALSQPVLLEEVIVPILHWIGERWQEGAIRVAQEHVATAVIRSLLGRLQQTQIVPDGAPVLVAATPNGQRHELGAMIVAVTATAAGWRVIYLGADLPAEEIALAAATHQAAVVALSLVLPGDEARLLDELQRLRQLLPAHCAVVAGGRAADAYFHHLEIGGALCLPDLPALRQFLAAYPTRLA